MAEIQLSEAVKIRSSLIDAHLTMKVVLWDCGPEQPVIPKAPEPPGGKDGDPKFDLAKLQFERTLHTYREALLAFERQEAEFKDWTTRNGGPIELIMWSVDARDAFERDARALKQGRQKKLRYHLSSRTPGREKLPNLGLPDGVRPGHGNTEIALQIAGEKEFVAALKVDPHFGNPASQ